MCLKTNEVKPGFTSLWVFLVGCFLAPLRICCKTWPTCCVCRLGSCRCNCETFTGRKCQSSPARKGWHMDKQMEKAPKMGLCICSYARRKCQKLHFMGFSSGYEAQGKMCFFLWLRCMASLPLLNARVLTYVLVTVKKTSSNTRAKSRIPPNASNLYTAEILMCQHSD